MPDDFRVARPDDAFTLMRLHQLCGSAREELLLDLPTLQRELARTDRLWVLSTEGEEPVAFIALSLEPPLRLGRIDLMGARGEPAPRRRRLDAAMRFVMEEVSRRGELDVLYSTTRNLTLDQQASTVECGFKVLGVFPNAASADVNRINGLTVWFAPDVLERKRHCGFPLHPVASPFFELARRQCDLPPLPAAPRPELLGAAAPLPELELIEAPRFVAERFRRLRERKSLSVNFYPFQEPNALIVSPDQSVEIFAMLLPEKRYANLLSERLTAAVDPVELYRRAVAMLYDRPIHYIEIINDAADTLGIECIVRAGFAPCGYFPCLKHAGNMRRDYVVFAKAFEFFEYTPPPNESGYTAFLLEFCKARSTLPKNGC